MAAKPERKRLFVGIDLADPIRERLREYVDRLQRELPPESVKWMRPEGWHLTLKFLGETEKQAEITRALRGINAKPFPIHFQRIGFFTPRSPRVFWIGVEAPEALPELAGAIEAALEPLGFEREQRRYSPHLTLARFGSGRPQGSAKDRNALKMYTLKQLLERKPELAEVDFGTMTAKEFILFQSQLSPKGSRYTKLERFALT
jgi:RNA 2',3'-cyclic 3'-phosphodiesterase